MPRDDEAKKIEQWASGGARSLPEDEGIDRGVGWDVRYEQKGSGAEPEREVWNQLLRELTGQAVEINARGVLQWDAELDYRQYAFVVGSGGKLHVSNVATGPATGNAEDPTSGGSVWRVY